MAGLNPALKLLLRNPYPMQPYRSSCTPNNVDPLFRHVKPGMAVIFHSQQAKISMAEVRRVNAHRQQNQEAPLFEVMDVHTGAIIWISGHQITHIVPAL